MRKKKRPSQKIVNDVYRHFPLCIYSEEHCTTPDTMDVSDGIVDLLSQLPLIKLNLKTNSSPLVRVHHLAEENCRFVTNVHTVFMELIFKKCTHLDQLIGEALMKDSVDPCPSRQTDGVYFVT